MLFLDARSCCSLALFVVLVAVGCLNAFASETLELSKDVLRATAQGVPEDRWEAIQAHESGGVGSAQMTWHPEGDPPENPRGLQFGREAIIRWNTEDTGWSSRYFDILEDSGDYIREPFRDRFILLRTTTGARSEGTRFFLERRPIRLRGQVLAELALD